MSKPRVIVLGSGPAGLTAALYLSRANLAPTVYEGLQPGGQLTITTEVDNFPGFPEGIMGPDLMDNMKAQCTRFGTQFHWDSVERLDTSKRPEGPFVLHTSMGEQVEADAVVVASGATARWLGLESEKRLQGHGVSACATCDGFFFQDVPVAVIGGGDSAMEEATFLTKFASKVYIIHRRDTLRASKIMQERAFKNDKIEFVWNTEVTEVLGSDKVEALALRNTETGETSHLEVKGLFLAIGHIPNTAMLGEEFRLDDNGYLLVEEGSTVTSVPGVFAAGDISDTKYKQAITAAGMGCKAALDCEHWLESLEDA